ncbi:MAG TPA: TIGR02646 family protein [Myxococcota bacterium]|nr:TIGR02646 family protein [Myxococcota bacterium]
MPVERGEKKLAEAARELDTALADVMAETRSGLARAHFDGLKKDGLREEFIKEQAGLCVYCESSLSADPAHAHLTIEHFRPLSKFPECALDWKNLYISCSRSSTCDRKKADDVLGEKEDPLPWPSEVDYQDFLGLRRSGHLYVRTDAPLGEEQKAQLKKAIGDDDQRPGLLNLNAEVLVRARVAAMDQQRTHLEKLHADRLATAAQREALATAMLREHPLPSFVSARLRWLRNQLGKAAPARKEAEE